MTAQIAQEKWKNQKKQSSIWLLAAVKKEFVLSCISKAFCSNQKNIFHLTLGELCSTVPARTNTIHQLIVERYHPLSSKYLTWVAVVYSGFCWYFPETLWFCKQEKTNLHIINIITTQAHPRFSQYFLPFRAFKDIVGGFVFGCGQEVQQSQESKSEWAAPQQYLSR